MPIETKLSEESIANLQNNHYLYDENNEENKKNFKVLLKKYQSLIADYHNQNMETKSSIAVLIEKLEKSNQNNQKLMKENEYLKKRINYMARRMDSLECLAGDGRCIRSCNTRYFQYNEEYDFTKPYPEVEK